MSEKQPPPGGSSGDDAVSDEVWERFVRDSELDIKTSAAPKEPSARARLVTDRLRKERDAAEAKGRGRKDKRRPAEPEGWRTGPAWQEMNGRAARKRRGWALLGIVLCAGLLLVALNPARALSVLTGEDGSGDTAASPLPAETGAPTGAPPSSDPDVPTLKEPFRGSPAAQYADGAAGIEAPEATALGGVPKKRVAAALADTRALLIDADLNPATLRGGRPEAAFALMDPAQKHFLGFLDTALTKPDEDHDPLNFFTRFDPTKVRLVGDVVKTRGRMTFGARSGGGVTVHADYTFVYPLVEFAPGSKEVERTIVRRILDVEIAGEDARASANGRLWVTKYDVDIANSACDLYDGYAHPQFHSEPDTGPAPSGPAVDPYDRSKPLDAKRQEGCGVVSRT
ncbi:hypothetical protein [Streptomyces sp. NBC_00083]|uniref:hypothetical protein n=1 Tax=Streptomyces sp. NBC_00083 TaxID=2975647 RepID=UPI0022532A7F|nr:hypothetical protein [Streptomyces sp. NBC_00083]MCX5385125.1 hypothetical protein [Streptomyces sp. NBC_00083]